MTEPANGAADEADTRPAPRVGIKDVAKRAGVSVGTVSNTINHPAAVSEERRAAVESAIRDLGYVPNHAARQLKVGQSSILGLVAAETGNPFYAALTRGAEHRAVAEGLGLFSASSELDIRREELYLGLFEQQRVRGILLTPVGAEPTAARAVATRGTPVILLDSPADDGLCTIGADDFAGGRLAADHLIEQGRHRIAVIGAPLSHSQVVRRHYGALAAAEEHPHVRVDFMRTEAMTIPEGRRVGEDILARPVGQRPDAVFATNDLLAIGLLQALTMTGRIRVPKDIAIIGYDDIDFCLNAVVPLSSIAQPASEIGERGVELVDAEIDDGSTHVHRHLVLPPRLIARTSTLGG